MWACAVNEMGTLRETRRSKVETVKLENLEGLERAQQFRFKKIPVMIIYRGESEFERLVGLPRREDLDRDSQTFFRMSGNVDLR